MITIKILLLAVWRRLLLWRAGACNSRAEIWSNKARRNLNISQKCLDKSRKIIEKVEKMVDKN